VVSTSIHELSVLGVGKNGRPKMYQFRSEVCCAREKNHLFQFNYVKLTLFIVEK
jgi:hypothetical protein